MFWNLWCERVKFLNPEDTSITETSVATSTSRSTLRLISSSCKIGENGSRQLWLKFGAGDATV